MRFAKVHIDVLQPHTKPVKGKGVGKSSVSANSKHHDTPCRSIPNKASGSWSHNMSAADSAAASPVPVAIEEDAKPDGEVPRNDDEDEMMYPGLVDRASQQVWMMNIRRSPSAELGLMTLTMKRRRRTWIS